MDIGAGGMSKNLITVSGQAPITSTDMTKQEYMCVIIWDHST